MTLSAVCARLDRERDARVQSLCDWLRIPSVSAVPAHHADCARAADFAFEHLMRMGFRTEFIATPGRPIVYGEWLGAPGAPTVMVYGHYDVQPADPLHLWTTPAFEPTIRDGCVYARGATDDKGQLLTHLKSAEAWLAETGKLPVNLKFVIEGEEEVGSTHLEDFLRAKKAALASDVAVVSDSSQLAPGEPAITYGLRGILACEVVVTGPAKDLHSGVYGGAVANPANGLARLLAHLHDDQGRVLIPGFYDRVVPLTAAERASFAALDVAKGASLLVETGAPAPHGEAGYNSLERRWARPTCDVNGMVSGWTGEGPKTIVPSRASAKITCRLVPDQQPDELLDRLEEYLRAKCPAGLTLELIRYHGCPAFCVDLNSPYMAAAERAITTAFGRAPVRIREGGSIPVIGTFREVLGIDTLMLGWGQNSDNLHSPNEHFSLDDFHRGTMASAALWAELAAVTV